MTRSRPLRPPLTFAVLVAFASLLVPRPGLAAARPPNILLVLGDNLGKDWIGCYGSDEQATPHIDRLAAGGTRFPRCWMTAYCSTSRAALMTGRYGFRTGWHTHHDAAIYGGGGFDWNRETTIARVLKGAGYATAITGKWQINDLYEQRDALARHGFDEHLVWTGAMVGEGNADRRWRKTLEPGGARALESRYWDPIVFRNEEHQVLRGKFGPDEYVNAFVDFMARHKEQPFFACYASPLTHIPPVTTPGSPDESASDRDKYIGMLRYLDGQVGRLVEELERLGLRENTVVLFTTDNGSSRAISGTIRGEPIRGGLGGQTEPGLDVPLIANCPGLVPAGVVSDALVDCTDFFPTFAELAGAPLPSDVVIDGHSFAPELTGRPPTAPVRRWMHAGYAGERAVRDRRYKLFADGRMFDVAQDWSEKHDLADSRDPRVVAARESLQSVLDSLPPDRDLPFPPRSGNAFRLRGENPGGVPMKSPQP